MNISRLAPILHEVRTPIQTIIGTAELLKGTNLDPEQQEYVRQLIFSADVLHMLVNDILDYEKSRKGNLRLEEQPCNLILLVEQVFDIISIEAYNKGLELAIDVNPSVPVQIYTDSMRLLQLLMNLVKNAIKFTTKGYIVIRIHTEEVAEKPFLVFRVIDTGIGIPNNKKRSVFQEFVQVSSPENTLGGGTGLGLAICSNLVSLMGGTIGVADGEGCGSEFWFKIPLKPVSTDLIYDPLPNSLDKKILVVDDCSIIQETITNYLKLFGFTQVYCANSGQEALELMISAYNEGKKFDLVFIDMILPIMDGWRLASEINGDKRINGSKLFLMVPEGQFGGEAKMKALSWFNGYLYKPIKIALLRQLLETSLVTDLDLPDAEVSSAEKKSSVLSVQKEGVLCCQETIDVLCVDDHPINLKILSVFLSDLGYNVFTASTGRGAVTVIAEHPEIKIVFMDIQLPDILGTEAASIIRKNGYSGSMIACSANSDRELNREYEASGFDMTLVKPFKKQQLQRLLTQWKETHENKN